jgi:hypothetical protein
MFSSSIYTRDELFSRKEVGSNNKERAIVIRNVKKVRSLHWL